MWMLRKLYLVAAMLACLSVFSVQAEYVPYPGRLPVAIQQVESAGAINVSLETWPGFRRSLTIVLPGIVIAGDRPRASACERELAAQALSYTRGFVEEAEQLYVNDMRMETSADTRAFSDLLDQDGGSLSRQLVERGLARPETIAADTPWCE